MNKSNHIGTRLRQLRKSRNEKQADVAKLLSKSRAAIGHYETGRDDLSIEDLRILSDHYNVDLEYFFMPEIKEEEFETESFYRIMSSPEVLKQYIKTAFLVIENKTKLNDSDFEKAFKNHQEIMTKVVERKFFIESESLIEAIDLYEKASNKGIVEAKINSIPLLLLFFLSVRNETIKLSEQVINESELSKEEKSYLLESIKPSESISDKEIAEEIDSLILELLSNIRKANEYRDIYEFYLAIRYFWNIAQDCNEKLNSTVGFEMMYSFALAGNKYAYEFLLAFRDINRLLNKR